MITIDWKTSVILIPKADLTFVSGTLYELDTDAFRRTLKALEESVHGMPNLKTHSHNTQVTVAGTTYARAIEILAPYSVEFEDGQYTVILKGSNNNIFDVAGGILVQNQVQIIPTNAAGLIVTTMGSGVTEQDKQDIADKVWDETLSEHDGVGSAGETLTEAADGSATPQQIANTVWDTLLEEHIAPHTFGSYLGGLSADLKVSMQENGSVATFSAWVELEGIPRFDLTSITSKLLNSLGEELYDLGPGTKGANGVFRWTLATNKLVKANNYVLTFIVTKGLITWQFNRGFAKV